MRRYFFPLWVIALITGTRIFAETEQGSIAAGHLCCEYQQRPLAVESLRPRLSWIVQDNASLKGD